MSSTKNEPLPFSLLGEIGTVETFSQALILYKRLGMQMSSKANRTRVEYENDIADLVSFLAESGITRVDQVTLTHLKVYQVELERRGYKASTRNRKTFAIKGFFRFLREYAITSSDVAAELIPPQVERGEPRFYRRPSTPVCFRWQVAMSAMPQFSSCFSRRGFVSPNLWG